VLPLRVDGLRRKVVYHFDDPDAANNAPAAMLLLTSCFGRTLWKYEYLGLTTVYKDVGCLTQTLYLQSTALGLAGYAVGGGPERVIARGLGVDCTEESYVGAFFVGHPEESRPPPCRSAP
jgi:SagB-type dehydrogenase family enzyme